MTRTVSCGAVLAGGCPPANTAPAPTNAGLPVEYQYYLFSLRFLTKAAWRGRGEDACVRAGGPQPVRRRGAAGPPPGRLSLGSILALHRKLNLLLRSRHSCNKYGEHCNEMVRKYTQ